MTEHDEQPGPLRRNADDLFEVAQVGPGLSEAGSIGPRPRQTVSEDLGAAGRREDGRLTLEGAFLTPGRDASITDFHDVAPTALPYNSNRCATTSVSSRPGSSP